MKNRCTMRCIITSVIICINSKKIAKQYKGVLKWESGELLFKTSDLNKKGCSWAGPLLPHLRTMCTATGYHLTSGMLACQETPYFVSEQKVTRYCIRNVETQSCGRWHSEEQIDFSKEIADYITASLLLAISAVMRIQDTYLVYAW